MFLSGSKLSDRRGLIKFDTFFNSNSIDIVSFFLLFFKLNFQRFKDDFNVV